jgi:hypothetical protein
VFVGVGYSAQPKKGGYMKIMPNGKIAWYIHPSKLPNKRGGTVGVQNSLAIGNLQGKVAVVSGSMGQQEYAIDAGSGKTLKGFPWFQADTNFATPALANLYGTGQVIIEGGDSTAGIAYGYRYTNGGHLRILSPTGNSGSGGNQGGGLMCQYNTDQVVWSSPAVGKLLGGGRTGITFGTGTFYAGAKSTNQITTVDDRCRRVWTATLAGSTTSSPALADNLGTGELNVLEAAKTKAGTSVYALHGSTGKQIWRTNLAGSVYGSVTTISLHGDHQDVLVPTTQGLFVLDGRTGRQLYQIWDNSFTALQGTPLVTVDPDGSVGVTIAGYKLWAGRLRGSIEHFKVTGASAAKVNAVGSWPMFHHDTHLTGNASIAQPSGANFVADTVVSPAAALVPERGALSQRQCFATNVCVTASVQGVMSTGANNYGQFGYGFASVTLDRTTPGAANVQSVSLDRVLFGTPNQWLEAGSVKRGPVSAGVFTKAYRWQHSSAKSWHVRMTYRVIYKNGTSSVGTLIGPYFRGFKA